MMSKKIAFLLFPGFEMLDVYGPISVFSSHKLNAYYKCLTVSQNAGPVPSSRGIQTVTEYDFDSCPPVDLLMVPGGSGARQEVDNSQLMDFMQRMVAPDASKSGSAPPYLLTVCTGAAFAARAGLLDGKKATTNKGAWAWATTQGKPGATAWQKQARWVEDGTVWTSAGVTAGIDMSLAFIAKRNGEEAAKQVATYLEYTGDYRDPSNDTFCHVIDSPVSA
ncbi:hypothetical protein CVIRNUC_000832 [Coccomyxa viridis]|uniref:DJ-1/PfpI domain-containing protein n=1 Tax=Coccomyxa viridis TaxID=1274662 RepID=A0AAV1HUV3_9CHLO|nr:hypothetical protein CVIRNUC_000832 [Coccomyxa viridis]